MFNGKLKVLSNRRVAHKTYCLRLSKPEEFINSSPGQFVNLKVVGESAPLLRRPFSLAAVDDDELRLIYRVVGRATWFLSTLETGDSIDTLGPLGRGFSYASNGGENVLAGGGIGLPPLMYLRDEMLRQGITPLVLVGAKTASEHYYQDESCPVQFSTDDGSKGYEGMVTDLLEKRLANGGVEAVFACGPNPMLIAVSNLVKKFGVRCQMAVETVFGCGTGLCQGCVIRSSTEYERHTGRRYRLACKEGPVFDTSEIHL